MAQWTSAWNAIGDGLGQVNEELRGLRPGSSTSTRRSSCSRAGPARSPSVPERRSATCSWRSRRPCPVSGEIRVSYRVAGAGWASHYDARLETGLRETKPSLEIVRRAHVFQRTGESWDNVQISVSTVRLNRGTARSGPAAASGLVPRAPRRGRWIGSPQRSFSAFSGERAGRRGAAQGALRPGESRQRARQGAAGFLRGRGFPRHLPRARTRQRVRGRREQELRAEPAQRRADAARQGVSGRR